MRHRLPSCSGSVVQLILVSRVLITNPWPKFVPLRALVAVWALATTLFGLVLAFPFALLGQVRSAKVRYGAIFLAPNDGSWGQSFMDRVIRRSAITLGFVVLARSATLRESLVEGELKHVRQNLVLGPLFVPVYVSIYVALLAWYRSFRLAYRRHPLELAAHPSYHEH